MAPTRVLCIACGLPIETRRYRWTKNGIRHMDMCVWRQRARTSFDKID